VDKPLDIVIKTRRKDLTTFLQLQADLAKHSQLCGEIYIIVPRQELESFADIVTNEAVLVCAEDVVGIAGYAEEFPDTWYTQQIVKLTAANIVKNQQYLVLDSNTLIGFDFDEGFFLKGDEYSYAVNELHDLAWELQSRNVLRLRTPGRLYGYRAANQIFIKDNALALVHYLESLYRDNIVRILLNYSDALCTEFWTEFALYGTFMHCVYGTAGHFFEARHDLIHFNFKMDFANFLSDVEAEAPLMIKFYKRRPGRYDLTSEEYAKYVKEIKEAYRRRLVAGPTP
jgi:hypothetical protein